MPRFVTSESVTAGHPDKVADQISDAVLDAALALDPNARVACECAVMPGKVLLFGEITVGGKPDYEAVARRTIREIGYTDPGVGFDADGCEVELKIGTQSPDIAQGVDRTSPEEQGAGDQGMMYGFACREGDVPTEFLPLPIFLSHRIVERLEGLRRSGEVAWLRPDGKAQVTVEYDGASPVRVHTVVVSTQHASDVDSATIERTIVEKVVRPVVPERLLRGTTFHVNPTGRFVVGGPAGDCGLTGRKIIVDTYGGVGRHGGGAFSGKDPSKVDRSAAYAMRWLAKNIVAADLAQRCETSVCYAIGRAEPIAFQVDTFGTGTIPDARIEEIVRQYVDLRPAALIRRLELKRPIYRQTARNGHFGRHGDAFTWERADLVEYLRRAAGATRGAAASTV